MSNISHPHFLLTAQLQTILSGTAFHHLFRIYFSAPDFPLLLAVLLISFAQISFYDLHQFHKCVKIVVSLASPFQFEIIHEHSLYSVV